MEGASASSSSEVLLVQCPVCAYLLPELPDLPVCRCRCCGAILAKKKGLVDGGLSDSENVGVGFGKGSIAMKLNNYHQEDERGGNGGLEAINRTLDLQNNCSSSRSRNKDALADSVGSGKREPISVRARFGQCTSDRSINRDEYGLFKHNLDVDDWGCRNDAAMNIGHHGYADARIDNGKWGPEGNVSLGSRGYTMDATARQKRGMNYSPLEASPKCDGSSSFDRVAGLENDRAELLRRIGELNEQLRRASDVAEKPSKERSGLLESRMDYSCSHGVCRQGLFGVNKQPLGQDHCVLGPPCVARGYQYSTQMYHNGCHDPSMDIIPRPLRRRPHKSPFQPACSCPNCFSQNWEALPLIPPPAFGNKMSQAHTSDNLVYNQQRLTRSSSGTRAKIDLGRPRKVIIALSGGAPFVTCCNCFEVLRLPWKLRMMGKNKNKMRCGACSSIFVCELISGKGMILPVPERSAKLSKPSPGDQKPNSGIVAGKDSSITSEFPNTNDASLRFSDYPHHSSYRSTNDVAERYVNVSKWCDETGVKENYVKDVSVATEIDISMNESANSCVSMESFEVRKDDDRLNDQNGSEVSKSSQNAEERRSNVFVNGQHIPVPEVEGAEKLAGPIQLGEYWYDVRAGFWGVIGHPCLGIIPPNIEEFNYPMPKHCAAGNTGVFVNGRELHKKDLDILVSRGLPVKEHKSYLIDISGKVVDEQTGEELDSLGKLAPTVERVGHGFGMKVPKWILEQWN